ncbi:MAG TPA: HDOD domain-containing protein [Polyangia bacterium]|nr:HDOD domain-containing protein [Polyangia bacterium]
MPATPIQKSTAPESVLVIDNDEAARKALEGALSRQGYQVKGSADVDEALRIARTGPIDVIIVGDKLAQLDAPVFLRRLSDGNVGAAAVVTGVAQTSTERIIENLRAGAVEFVRKPLQPATVMDAIHRAVGIARKRQGVPEPAAISFPDSVLPRKPTPLLAPLAAILDRLRETPVEIPSSPIIIGELRRAMSQTRTSLDDVARLAQYDQSISLELLKLANSPAYSRGTRTSDIKTAVGRVGLKQLEVVVQAAFERSGHQPSEPHFRHLLSSLWRYGAATAIGMRVLAENLGAGARLDPGVAYAAGLFRDVGAALLVRLVSEGAPAVAPPEYMLFIRQRHEAVAAQLLSGLGLDPAIQQVGGSHHAQSAPTGSSLYWPLSAVADELAHTVVTGGDVTRLARRGASFAATCADTLRISEGVLRKATDQVVAELGPVNHLFG